MKLSRQSSGCQRNRSISRMSRCVYLVQSLNRSRPFSDMGMTPSHQRTRPADSPQTLRSWFWKAAAIACAALAVFASGLFADYFEDEYAYISQSYYADLFFAGRFNDLAWLDFPAYDLPPLPKYLIGLSFRLAQLPMPKPGAAWAWYDHYGHFGTSLTLCGRSPAHPLCGSTRLCRDLCMRHSDQGWASRNHRRGRSDVQSALSPARPPSHVRRSERSVHAGRAGDLPVVVAADLVRTVRHGDGPAPLPRRDLRRPVASLQVQRISRA